MLALRDGGTQRSISLSTTVVLYYLLFACHQVIRTAVAPQEALLFVSADSVPNNTTLAETLLAQNETTVPPSTLNGTSGALVKWVAPNATVSDAVVKWVPQNNTLSMNVTDQLVLANAVNIKPGRLPKQKPLLSALTKKRLLLAGGAVGSYALYRSYKNRQRDPHYPTQYVPNDMTDVFKAYAVLPVDAMTARASFFASIATSLDFAAVSTHSDTCWMMPQPATQRDWSARLVEHAFATPSGTRRRDSNMPLSVQERDAVLANVAYSLYTCVVHYDIIDTVLPDGKPGKPEYAPTAFFPPSVLKIADQRRPRGAEGEHALLQRSLRTCSKMQLPQVHLWQSAGVVRPMLTRANIRALMMNTDVDPTLERVETVSDRFPYSVRDPALAPLPTEVYHGLQHPSPPPPAMPPKQMRTALHARQSFFCPARFSEAFDTAYKARMKKTHAPS